MVQHRWLQALLAVLVSAVLLSLAPYKSVCVNVLVGASPQYQPLPQWDVMYEEDTVAWTGPLGVLEDSDWHQAQDDIGKTRLHTATHVL